MENNNQAELLIVMPVYNEEASVRKVVLEWFTEIEQWTEKFTFLIIDDGSKDSTPSRLEGLAQRLGPRIEIIRQANQGHGQSCLNGYRLAVERNIPFVFQIDSDGQCDPQFFSAFWKSREEADVLFGVRRTRDDGLARVLISGGCRMATSLLAGTDLKDANVPYRLIRTDALKEALGRIPADFDMQNVALTVALKRDRRLRWKYIPIHFRDRQGGTNSINIRRILAMGFTLLVNLHKIGK